MGKIKLIDVANEAGVSKSTVSQFLNGRYQYMSKDTKERVERAVEKLHYVPNNIARSLKTNKTNTVGVIVRDVAGFYTSQAIRGMDDYCKNNGYNMIIYNTDFNPVTEAQAIRSLGQLRVDGLIITSSGSHADLIKRTSNSETPVVEFQLEHDNSKKNIIVSDYRQAAFEATEHLIELGHRRICFVTQKFTEVRSRRERYQGYVNALKKHRIPVDKDLIQYWNRNSGLHNSPEHILNDDNAPTAFFAQHLAITVDLLNALDYANITIPGDVSVLGFDDLPMAEFFKVPVTVVQQQPYVVGTEAAKLLIDQISNPDQDVKRVTVPCTLIIRKSCK